MKKLIIQKDQFAKLVIILLCLSTLNERSIAQTGTVNEEELKAAFIVKFLRNIEFAKRSTLKIVYFGVNEFQFDSLNQALQTYLKKPNFVLDKTVKISNVKNADVVFIEEEMNPFINDIYDALAVKVSFLTITSRSNSMVHSMINFIETDNGLTFEINARLMKAKNLKYSKEILRSGGREIDILDLYFQLELQLQENLVELDSHQQEIKRKNNELVRLREDIEAATKEISNLKLITKSTILENLQLAERTSALNAKIAKQSQEISSKSDYINLMSLDIDQKARTLKKVTDRLLVSRAEQAQLDKKLTTKTYQVNTQKMKLVQYNKEVQALNNTINIIIFLVCILAFFIGLLWYLVKQNRKAAESMLQSKQQQIDYFATKAELTALKAQIRPHFLFNTLNTIHIAIDENPKKAESVLEDLAELFRCTLGISNRELHLLESEMNMVTRYMNIEKARYGGKLQFKVDEILNNDAEILIPVLTIQPLVENAVKYSMLTSEEVAEVIIKLRIEDFLLIVEIADNGSGSTDSCPDLQGFGISTENIKQRLFRLYDDKASLTLETFESGGAKATLIIPSRPVKDFM